jgi:isopentenyl-diphosphate delta-isomerase
LNPLADRKLAHLDICAEGDVEGRHSTLLEDVHLLHEALPELAWGQVDASVELLGRRILAPIVICGMTGGAPRAGEINRVLAGVAQKFGLAMGLGSQRAMLLDPAATDTYAVRDVAPDILLLANLGAVQARESGPEAVGELVSRVGADALCVHLNVAQELVQDDGDRDFRGSLEAISTLVEALPVPVVVKETGCGLGPDALARLRAVGVAAVDVSGSGGTTWTGVEAQRGSARQRALGEALREWGIPTAAAVAYARRAGLTTIASGGIRTPLDAVRAMALGADVAGLALPFLRAFHQEGAEGVARAAERLVEGISALLLLVGARNVAELRRAPRVLGPARRGWIEIEGPWGTAPGPSSGG